MKDYIRRGLITAAATGAALTMGAGAAFADDCVNLSRNTNVEQATKGAKEVDTGEAFGTVLTKGNWVYLGDTWLLITPGTESLFGGAIDTSAMPGVNGNFTNGAGDGLLERSGTASDGRRCAAVNGETGLAGECGEHGEH